MESILAFIILLVVAGCAVLLDVEIFLGVVVRVGAHERLFHSIMVHIASILEMARLLLACSGMLELILELLGIAGIGDLGWAVNQSTA